MRKEDLAVGRIIYCEPTGNNARFNSDIKEGIIEKVGNQYFYVRVGYSEEKFKIETGSSHFNNSGYQAYLDKQEILDKKELLSLFYQIKKDHFDIWGKPKLSLNQLRLIKQIIYQP